MPPPSKNVCQWYKMKRQVTGAPRASALNCNGLFRWELPSIVKLESGGGGSNVLDAKITQQQQQHNKILATRRGSSEQHSVVHQDQITTLTTGHNTFRERCRATRWTRTFRRRFVANFIDDSVLLRILHVQNYRVSLENGRRTRNSFAELS